MYTLRKKVDNYISSNFSSLLTQNRAALGGDDTDDDTDDNGDDDADDRTGDPGNQGGMSGQSGSGGGGKKDKSNRKDKNKTTKPSGGRVLKGTKKKQHTFEPTMITRQMLAQFKFFSKTAEWEKQDKIPKYDRQTGPIALAKILYDVEQFNRQTVHHQSAKTVATWHFTKWILRFGFPSSYLKSERSLYLRMTSKDCNLRRGGYGLTADAG